MSTEAEMSDFVERYMQQQQMYRVLQLDLRSAYRRQGTEGWDNFVSMATSNAAEFPDSPSLRFYRELAAVDALLGFLRRFA